MNLRWERGNNLRVFVLPPSCEGRGADVFDASIYDIFQSSQSRILQTWSILVDTHEMWWQQQNICLDRTAYFKRALGLSAARR